MKLFLSVATILALLTFLAISPLLAQETYFEDESEEAYGHQYLEDGQTSISGHIGGNDREDWYTLPGFSYNTSVTLTFNPAEVEIDWDLVDNGVDPDYWDDRDPVTLATLTNFGSPETVTVQTFGHLVIPLWVYSGEGTYTITIGEVKCQGFDEIEPNDTQIYSNLAPHDIIEGHVCAGDSDWYVLDGQQAEYWSVDLNFDPSEVEVDWEIYSDDTRMAVGTNYGSPDLLACYVPGKCYIHVWQFSGSGDYMINLAGYTNTDIK
jgi:hypothetical protein